MMLPLGITERTNALMLVWSPNSQGTWALIWVGETMNSGAVGDPGSFDGWLSAVWFCLPHVDLRVDGIYTAEGIPAVTGTPATRTGVTTWLAQFHVFL